MTEVATTDCPTLYAYAVQSRYERIADSGVVRTGSLGAAAKAASDTWTTAAGPAMCAPEVAVESAEEVLFTLARLPPEHPDTAKTTTHARQNAAAAPAIRVLRTGARHPFHS
jgi:hypothetical protein